MNTPIFSLIVATLGRDQELRLLLDSLKNQTFKDFHIIIVDQNEQDIIAPIVKEYSGHLSIQQLRQSKRGVSAARNSGLAEAKGEIITFPDDDCEYPPNTLERVYNLFKENPTWDGLSVSSADKNGKGRISRLAARSGTITKLNILTRAIEFGLFIRSKTRGNVSYDEDLGVGSKSPWWSDEGPDLILRLMENGSVIRYEPSIVIYHPDPTVVYNEKVITRSYRYGLGRGRFLMKHDYPFWFVMYVWGLYVAGIGIGIAQFNRGKIKYYYHGLKGRIQGYFSK